MILRFRRRQWTCLRYLLSILACLCLSIVWTIALRPGAAVLRDGRRLASRSEHAPLAAAPRANEPRWLARHRSIAARAARGDIELLFLGDSITQGWQYSPLWKRLYEPRHALNAGIASDRVEQLLWRVRHGGLDRSRPKAVVLLGGINDLAVASPERIAACMGEVIAEIHRRSPATKILLLGVFPSGARADDPRRARIKALNLQLARYGKVRGVTYADIGRRFLAADGALSKDVMYDHLHLTQKGYRIWADAMAPALATLLGTGSRAAPNG